MILPGNTLGMLGGGQLGRMFTVAARTLGYRVLVLDPDPHSPAGHMADEHLDAPYDDARALEIMASRCAVVTTEFENVPAASMQALAASVAVRPSASSLLMTQDRAREKDFIRATGLSTAPFRVVAETSEVETAFAELGAPAILKRTVMGYDGKGQAAADSRTAACRAFQDLGSVPCVLERRVDLATEVSVVLARAADGGAICFPLAENIHRGGILHMSIVPARISHELAEEARQAAVRLADALDYVGLMAVEFFVTTAGELLVNEIAPRPHNSGHFTVDACVTSQFEQQVRAVCGLPFGDTRLLSPVVMVNLLGDLWSRGEPDWSALFARGGAKLHLYGKTGARPGRKMGHFCVLGEDLEANMTEAEVIFEALVAGRA